MYLPAQKHIYGGIYLSSGHTLPRDGVVISCCFWMS